MARSQVSLRGTLLPASTADKARLHKTISIRASNTSGVEIVSETTAGLGLSGATLLTTPSTKAKFLVITPPSTNTEGLRFTGSTQETGIPLSSQGTCSISIVTATPYYLYTTGSSAVSGIRLSYY